MPEQQPERAGNAAAFAQRDLYPFDALDPDRPLGSKRRIHVRKARLLAVAQRGQYAVMEASETVAEVLRNPEVIFTGIRSDADEAHDGDGWFCYCGRPKTRHGPSGRSLAAPDRVFLVFVTRQGIAYNWRWEHAEPDGMPKCWEERFRKKVFPT